MDVCEYRFTFQLGKKANMFHFLSVRWVIIEHERSKKDPPSTTIDSLAKPASQPEAFRH